MERTEQVQVAGVPHLNEPVIIDVQETGREWVQLPPLMMVVETGAAQVRVYMTDEEFDRLVSAAILVRSSRADQREAEAEVMELPSSPDIDIETTS